MGAPRFFAPDALSPSSVGSEIALPDAVVHHAVRVRRLAPGDAIALFDGRGGEYGATITRTGRREAFARIDRFDPVEREAPLAVTLAQAIVATDTMDAIVRHAVELGAAAIQPIVSERSARFPAGAQGANRLAHWRQVVVAACEQCGRNRVPEVRDPLSLGDWLSHTRAGIVLDAVAGASLATAAPASELDALVGPEGGLTEREVAQASRAGLRAVRLGPRMLRAETAALAALATVNLMWGDFR